MHPGREPGFPNRMSRGLEAAGGGRLRQQLYNLCRWKWRQCNRGIEKQEESPNAKNAGVPFISKTVSTYSELVFQVATGDEPECEYYDDWWIFGEEGSGDSAEDGEEEEEANFRRRRRRQAEDDSGDGSADGGDEAADGGGGGNGTVADGEGGNSTKKEIDLSIFSKRCKPEKV